MPPTWDEALQRFGNNERALRRLGWEWLLHTIRETFMTEGSPWWLEARGHELPRHFVDMLDAEEYEDSKRQRNGLDTPSARELFALMDQIKKGVPPAADQHTVVLGASRAEECSFCGQGLCYAPGVRYKVDGARLRATTDCTLADGPFICHLRVPSGILAVGTDFRRYERQDIGSAEPIPSGSLASGQAELLRHLKRGIVLVGLHEDSGALYRRPDGTILVGRRGLEESRIPEANTVDGFWRSFADGDQIPAGAEGVGRIPVMPGTYAFTVHSLGLDRAAREKDEEEPTERPIEIEIRRVADV